MGVRDAQLQPQLDAVALPCGDARLNCIEVPMDFSAAAYAVGVIQRTVLSATPDPRLAALARKAWAASVNTQQYRDLLEVLDDRHGAGVTSITSQMPVEEWHQIIGAATLADAIKEAEPKAQRIQLTATTIRNEEDLDAWLDSARQHFQQSLKRNLSSCKKTYFVVLSKSRFTYSR